MSIQEGDGHGNIAASFQHPLTFFQSGAKPAVFCPFSCATFKRLYLFFTTFFLDNLISSMIDNVPSTYFSQQSTNSFNYLTFFAVCR